MSEPISWFEGEDGEMLDAIREAQASFVSFVEAIELDSRNAVPVLEEALVKYAFPNADGRIRVEHMFLSEIEKEGDRLVGSLSSTPRYVAAVREGDRVEIDPARVTDWLYVVNGTGVGGWTFRVMWKRFSDRERESFAHEAPFIWLRAL